MTARPRSQLFCACFALLTSWSVAGCAHPKPPPLALPAPPPSVVDRIPAGSTLAIRRPTPGVAQLSLWLDVGSRDAKVPQIATVSGWWAAEQAGAEARVLPDGTEIELLCNTRVDGVDACVRRLIRALAPPAPGAREMERLRERLRATRRRALTDNARAADVLALEALLGDAARSFQPLGSEEDDAALTAGAVSAFSSAFYGPSRALLIGAGEVGEQELAQAFAQARQASAPPAARNLLSFAPRSGLLVQAADRDLIALALALPSTYQAASIAHRFREIYSQAQARVSALRGGAVLHVHMAAGKSPLARLQRAVFDLRRLMLEAPLAPTPEPEDALDTLVHHLGESWAARGSAQASTGELGALGVALLVRNPAEMAPESPDAAARLERWKRDAEKAVAAGEQNSRGDVKGDVDALQASVAAANGARIDVVRRNGDRWFAAAVRFAGGSAFDPLTRHGRAALLATLMADGCGFASGRALDARLVSLDARITPLVDAAGLGIMISAPSAHSEAALDALLRCAVRPARSMRAAEDARVRLIRALWGRSDARLAAALARSLAPAAPGALAPWGAPFGVSAIDAGELRRLHSELLVGSRLHIWVAADGDPAALARFVARRVSHLPAGNQAPAPAALGPALEMNGELADVEGLRVLVGLRTDSTLRGSPAASVFARALGDQLAARAGRVTWTYGDVTGSAGFAAVGLAVKEEELGAIEALVRDSLHELATRPEAWYRAALERASLSQAAKLSSAAGYVEAAFRGQLTRADLDTELSLIKHFALERPSFFVLRPAP